MSGHGGLLPDLRVRHPRDPTFVSNVPQYPTQFRAIGASLASTTTLHILLNYDSVVGMAKWVAAFGGLLVVLGILLYRIADEGETIHVEIPEESASKVAELPAPKTVKIIERAPKVAPEKESPETTKFDPTSDEFSRELDVGIPDGFKSKMATCKRDGVDPNAKITISYKLHIEDDVVSASKVTVKDSNLGNTTLEQCIVSAVQDARWVAADMPDFSEEQDIFVRMRSLDKYLETNEQVEAKEQKKAEE